MFVRKNINKIFIIALILIFSCSKEKSTTNYQDVYIYTSEEDKGAVVDIVNNNLFDFTYNTPNTEKKYRPIFNSGVDFMNAPSHSILMMISIESIEDTTIDAISNHLATNGINLVNDYYVEDQILFIL